MPGGRAHSSRIGLARLAFTLAAMSLLTLGVAACGSSKPRPSSAQVGRQTCRQVKGTLSDGPEPEASFASGDGAGPAKRAVSLASRTLDTICPGATS
jgi:hypothetical protein